MNLPGGVNEDDSIWAVLPEQAIAQFTLNDGLFGVTLTGTVGRLAQLAFNCRCQAVQVALHQVVVGAGLHAGHSDILADTARDDDERKVEAAFLENLECGRRVERWEI